MSNTTMGVKLDEETRTRLKALAETRRRSAHWLMKEAITEYLEREERVERRNRQADVSWEQYRTTGAHLSHEAMEAWLDTWGTDREGPCPDLER